MSPANMRGMWKLLIRRIRGAIIVCGLVGLAIGLSATYARLVPRLYDW
jgi:hypothetical protein